jgi:Mannosylglycerate hydrolase MGH1-like glycoside hydrolase domain
LRCAGTPDLLFTENETNSERLWGVANSSPYVKDAFDDYVVRGWTEAVNPARTGTKAAALYVLDIPAEASIAVHLRLCPAGAAPADDADVVRLFAARVAEADQFYASITPSSTSPAEAAVMRQALASMLWSKQYYFLDLDRWLEEHHVHPLRDESGGAVRNRSWFHMVNDDVISMPDTWEYPWYASWDLAFHTVALAMVDLDFAKDQLELMLHELYLHPNGQLPAYEWNFSDVNPPVHAWATLLVYESEVEQRGAGDVDWLKRAFQKLLVNFTWWVNRKDPSGRNVFEGGFLGLDNIGVFDRSSPLPTGGRLEQSDGTAWMAFFAQAMLGIAIELSQHDELYEDMVIKFAEHFVFIAAAMDRIGANRDELWDEEDGFFYDVLRLPDGQASRLKVRSMVGLLPLCASMALPGEGLQVSDELLARLRRRIESMPELLATIHDARAVGVNGRRMLAVLDEDKLRRVLARMLDESEFLSPHGLRALSRVHAEQPFTLDVHGQRYEVRYLPGESDSGMFGGNSNWRGPVWFPVNYLILRGLLHLYAYYGDGFTVECPTGSGRQCTLFEVAEEISRRLVSIFLPGPDGRRPVYGGAERFHVDPLWNHLLLFYEYFHGDNGAGLGASHQTGWTGLVARIIQVLGYLEPEDLLSSALKGHLVYGSAPR